MGYHAQCAPRLAFCAENQAWPAHAHHASNVRKSHPRLLGRTRGRDVSAHMHFSMHSLSEWWYLLSSKALSRRNMSESKLLHQLLVVLLLFLVLFRSCEEQSGVLHSRAWCGARPCVCEPGTFSHWVPFPEPGPPSTNRTLGSAAVERCLLPRAARASAAAAVPK